MPKVLVIGEQSHMLQLLTEKFAAEGFAVVTVPDQTEAAGRVLIERPDLIVLDQHLGNDPAFMRRLEQIDADLPVIILSTRTARPEPVTEKPAQVAYMKLPFKPSQLLALARQQLY